MIILWIIAYILGWWFTFYKMFQFHPFKTKNLMQEWQDFAFYMIFLAFWYIFTALVVIMFIWKFFIGDWDKISKS